MGTGIRKRPGTNNKVTNYFSHEFIIQNHGDIATCFSMVFIVGLMFQITQPLAAPFITPSYNVTELSQTPVYYTYGAKDICLVFFYSIIAIIFHAIIQEYALDKAIPKTRLSKTKERKFNESGQLLAFYATSVAWIGFIAKENGFALSVSDLWVGYPHVGLSFLTKFFFILQLSYWVHVLPELYFTKAKREQWASKITFAAVNFFVCATMYILNLTRIGSVLLFIDYTISGLFHVSRLFYILGKNKLSKSSFRIYNVLFVLARLAGIILTIFVFWFGLKASSIEQINFAEGNFNTPVVRLVCLTVTLALQAWMLWNFILFHCKKIRENKRPIVSSSKQNYRAKKAQQQQLRDESEVDSGVEERDLKE